MDNVYELANVEIHEYCALNVESGEKSFSKKKSNPCFTGLYFKNGTTFLGLYRSSSGPKIYYDGKEYPVCKDLSISLTKVGKHRKFCIYLILDTLLHQVRTRKSQCNDLGLLHGH